MYQHVLDPSVSPVALLPIKDMSKEEKGGGSLTDMEYFCVRYYFSSLTITFQGIYFLILHLLGTYHVPGTLLTPLL